MSERSEAERQADLEWLGGGPQPVEDHTSVLDQAELAELARAAQRRAAAGQSSADGATPAAASPASGRPSVGGTVPGAARAASVGTSPAKDLNAKPVRTPPPPVPPRARRASGGPGRPGRPPKKKHPVRRVVLILTVLLIAWLAWLVTVPLIALDRITTVADEPSARPAGQPGTAILLVGSDRRDDLTAAEQAQLGTGSEPGERTDTMMILYTPPSGRSVLVSLPRDSYVSIPGHGHNKLNAAYSLGGPQLLVQTVEQETGLRLDGYVEIGFGGFVRIIDAVGGIRLCLDQPMVDQDSHTNLPAGCQTLTGVQALGYVRMRKADPTGDIGRTKRQRQMLAAVIKKAVTARTFIDPFRYWSLWMAGAHAVRRGSDTGPMDLLAMTRGMQNIASGKGLTLVVPISNANATTAAGSSILWDTEQAKAMFAQLASGNTGNLDKYAK